MQTEWPTDDLRQVVAQWLEDGRLRESVVSVQRRWLVADGEPYVALSRLRVTDRNIGSGMSRMWQPTREEWRDLPKVSPEEIADDE